MMQYLMVLVFFLLAFAGLATGLLLKRRGLRGGCGSSHGSPDDCRCQSSAESGIPENAIPPLPSEKNHSCCKETLR